MHGSSPYGYISACRFQASERSLEDIAQRIACTKETVAQNEAWQHQLAAEAKRRTEEIKVDAQALSSLFWHAHSLGHGWYAHGYIRYHDLLHHLLQSRRTRCQIEKVKATFLRAIDLIVCSLLQRRRQQQSRNGMSQGRCFDVMTLLHSILPLSMTNASVMRASTIPSRRSHLRHREFAIPPRQRLAMRRCRRVTSRVKCQAAEANIIRGKCYVTKDVRLFARESNAIDTRGIVEHRY